MLANFLRNPQARDAPRVAPHERKRFMQDEEWLELSSRTALDHPYVKVEMREVQLPDGRVIADWPIIHTKDYINALVLNEQGQALILEGYKHALGRSSWQVLGGYLEAEEEPLAAAQRELLEETGYAAGDWRHLGSFIMDPNRYTGLGHFFLARNAGKVAEADHDDLEKFTLRWVTLEELQAAVLDGRVGAVSYALNISLGLLSLAEQ
jgi:ADP-ribose pyrophosphatase